MAVRGEFLLDHPRRVFNAQHQRWVQRFRRSLTAATVKLTRPSLTLIDEVLDVGGRLEVFDQDVGFAVAMHADLGDPDF